MALQAVIFDLDDTLYDFSSMHRPGLEAMACRGAELFGMPKQDFLNAYQEADRQIKQEQPYAAACHNRTLILQRALEWLALPSLGTDLLALYESYWGVFLERIRPRPGAVELLQELRCRGIRIGICTDMTAHIQHRKLAALGLAEAIDCMVSSEEAGVEKPRPEIFQMCLRKLGAEASGSMMVGDAFARDVCGAHAAGLVPVWLNAREERAPAVDFAYREIHRLEELQTML
ncbi:MAG: HAD-IA family hydrolase [Eubacteriales bacterium]|nr:HAD-IA family hydrolase [Eubacteriales bacterium]